MQLAACSLQLDAVLPQYQGDRAMHGKALEGSRLDESAWQAVFFVQLSSLQRFCRSPFPGE
ncbi:hypothetical protein DNJ95_18015 [Stutzerimonas kirkiae]|uniref:Uncharacterized protein n=1 Tax=Stutzerimonas kirkiae TaxID=2211392 RepID=A0A4Q9QYZ8_9GAMM|nr:hypothetical protein DNJ96_17440 [Stutzerimonas kirkiae]TBU98488.1 hypothetical protein DNJ95_18015 [Stutzerimonas kirkiae]